MGAGGCLKALPPTLHSSLVGQRSFRIAVVGGVGGGHGGRVDGGGGGGVHLGLSLRRGLLPLKD